MTMQDAKVVEYACLALSRIAEALARSPEHLDMLCNHGLVSNAVQLVTVTEYGSMTSQLSISTYYGLIRLLTSCASGSPAVAESLLQANLPTTMHNLLARYAAFSALHVPTSIRLLVHVECPSKALLQTISLLRSSYIIAQFLAGEISRSQCSQSGLLQLATVLHIHDIVLLCAVLL